MQSTVNIDDVLMLGEVCIVEVKGRATKSDWNDEVCLQKVLDDGVWLHSMCLAIGRR